MFVAIANFLTSQARIGWHTSATVEWSWVAGRILVAIATAVGAYLFLSDSTAATVVYGAGGFVLAYNAVLAVLIARRRVAYAFLLGFVLDNVTLATTWWWAAGLAAGDTQSTDLDLALLPILIAGVVRLTWSFGIAYVLFWLGWLAWVTLHYYDPASREVQQLPVRIIFIGMTALITAHISARLVREMKRAERLRAETEAVAEIGRLVGSTLDTGTVFHRFVDMTRKLIPFERLVLAMTDVKARTFEVAHVSGPHLPGWGPGAVIPIPPPADMLLLDKKQPQIFDEVTSTLLMNRLDPELRASAGEIRSLMAVPVVSGDEVVAILIARSSVANAFSTQDMDLLTRIAAHITGAISNSLRHAGALQLAHEHEMRVRADIEKRELQRVSEAKNHFLSTMSHELKTPLTSMIAFNDLVLRNRAGNLSVREIDQLKIVRRNGERLKNLVDDLLDVSRIDSGSLKLEPSQFDLQEVFNEIESSLAPFLEGKHQALKLETPCAAISIVADRDRLVQVISNLVSNSSKYSPDGSTVELNGWLDDDRLHIEVRDHGIGISKEDLPKVFSAFFRADNEMTKAQPGTGLGLQIVKGIVDAHGGEICVDSEQGAGTTVSLWLPTAKHDKG
ncbi:MAG: GAF domain-containing sensor histidine kinase [Dehalococcoidia bacterium]